MPSGYCTVREISNLKWGQYPMDLLRITTDSGKHDATGCRRRQETLRKLRRVRRVTPQASQSVRGSSQVSIVVLKVSTYTWSQGVIGISNLSLFIGPFEILDRLVRCPIGCVTSSLSHSSQVVHVSLTSEVTSIIPLHIVLYPVDQIREDLSCLEVPDVYV
ncbi:hypothetical protein Tco_0071013 [Tanacetum coccineum]